MNQIVMVHPLTSPSKDHLSGLGFHSQGRGLEPIGVDEASRANFKCDDLCTVGS